jgi:hypothetical protein
MIVLTLVFAFITFFTHMHYQQRGIQAALSYFLGNCLILFCIAKGLGFIGVITACLSLGWIVRQLPKRGEAKEEVK